MKLRHGTVLVSAALVATTGLAGFALTGATPSSAQPVGQHTTQAKTAYGVGEAKANDPLLYAKNKRIHDGEKVIRIKGFDKLFVTSVDRLSGGYLVGANTWGPGDISTLYVVGRDGSSKKLGEVFEGYDINLAKDRIVAMDYKTDRAVVYSNKGKVVAKTAKAVSQAQDASLGFVENDVSIVSYVSAKSDKQKAVRWNLKTSKLTPVAALNMLAASFSPGGSYIVGTHVTKRKHDFCLAVASDPRANKPHRWITCDWQDLGQFSPSGTRILATPAGYEGFLDRVAAFDVRTGPKKPVANFKAPRATSEAIWADNEHLWLAGGNTMNTEFSGHTWIKTCDLGGWCKTVAKADKDGYIVLGGGVY